MKKVKIGLALGGGASLGFAHIGVLKVLEEYGIEPDFIAGTSMGSIVGAAYACGLKADDIIKIIDDFKLSKIVSLKPFSALKDGAFATVKFENFIKKYIEQTKLEETKIPFRCNSVDLLTGKEYVFKEGDIFEAVRASFAIPGLFKPIKKDGMMLVDGGLINNVPYDIVKDMGADYVIGINVLNEYDTNTEMTNVVRIVVNALNLLQIKYEEYKHEAHGENCDHYLKVKLPLPSDNFSKEQIMKSIEMGEQYAREHIDEILKEIDEKEKELNSKEVIDADCEENEETVLEA